MKISWVIVTLCLTADVRICRCLAYFSPISMKLDIRNLHVTQLRIYEFRRDRFREGCAFCVGTSGITFTAVP
jgi:hypothetical protein